MKKIVLLAALALAGCGIADTPAPAPDLAPPNASLMLPPEDLPDVPEGSAVNGPAETNVIDTRVQCSADKRTIRGLQRYIRTIRTKKGE